MRPPLPIGELENVLPTNDAKAFFCRQLAIIGTPNEVPELVLAMRDPKISDMARYAPLLATGAGLSPATAAQRQAWTPLTTSGVRLQYGLGITQLGDWVGHDGSIFGYSTIVFHLPGRGATVVVAGNAADETAVPSQALWGEIVKILYPDTLPSW